MRAGLVLSLTSSRTSPTLPWLYRNRPCSRKSLMGRPHTDRRIHRKWPFPYDDFCNITDFDLKANKIIKHEDAAFSRTWSRERTDERMKGQDLSKRSSRFTIQWIGSLFNLIQIKFPMHYFLKGKKLFQKREHPGSKEYYPRPDK